MVEDLVYSREHMGFVPRSVLDKKTTKLIDFSKIEPQVKWEDIKVGNVYHIPPFDGNKRSDIKINYCCGSFFTYIENGNYYISSAKKDSPIHKMMVVKKK